MHRTGRDQRATLFEVCGEIASYCIIPGVFAFDFQCSGKPNRYCAAKQRRLSKVM